MSIVVDAPKEWPSELMRLMSEADDDSWSEVVEFIEKHPKEASFIGPHYRQTQLHVACLRYPPLHVVQKLVQTAPETASVSNTEGETPLHLAVNCSSEDIQMLLMEVAPQTVNMVDQYGDSPLHLATKNGATLRILEKMVGISPRATCLPNLRGVTPFSLLNRSYVEAESLEDVEHEEYAEDWEAALLFLRANMRPEDQSLLVHAAAQESACPKSLLKVLMRFFPCQALVRDSWGKTPLLWACETVEMKEPEFVEEMDGFKEDSEDELMKFEDEDNLLLEDFHLQHNYPQLLKVQVPQETEDDSLLALLVNWNPHAAHIADPEGRYPLAVALENGKVWDQGIQRLVRAAPQALETRDRKTRLLPFQLSKDLTTTYNLLRSFPQNVSHGIV